MQLENEVEQLERVVVTGARGALGSTVTETFLEAGCSVVGVDIEVDETGELVEDAERDGLYWRHLDATDAEEVAEVVDEIREDLGSIDALVNCAGGYRWTHIDEVDEADLDFLLGANLRSALLLTREVLPGMKETGYGRIVFMSSKSTLNPGEGEGPYASTKAGLNALAQSAAEEVKETDITINALLPSIIDTPQNREAMPEADFSTWVERDQLAEIIFRLTQPFGDPINGALIPVAGQV